MIEVTVFRRWCKNSFDHSRCLEVHPQKQLTRLRGKNNWSKDPEDDRSLNWSYFSVTAPGMKRKGNERSQLIKHLLWFNESGHLFLLLFTGLCEFINCNQKGKLRQETFGILYKNVSFQTELDLEKPLITVLTEYFKSHWKMGIHSFVALASINKWTKLLMSPKSQRNRVWPLKVTRHFQGSEPVLSDRTCFLSLLHACSRKVNTLLGSLVNFWSTRRQ